MKKTWLINHINKLGDKSAIVDKFGEFSYADLFAQIQQFKIQLDKELADNQVVAILSDYNFYSVALFLALVQKKTIIAPIVSTNTEEVQKRLNVLNCDSEIRIAEREIQLVQHNKSESHAMIQLLVDNNQSGLILFSSGSTGAPKAMIHNLDNLLNSYQGKKLKKLNMLVFLMFDHIGGLNTLLNTLSMGAKIVFPENRNPEYIAGLIATQKIHVLPASPTFLNMLLMANVEDKYDLSSLKMITYGTESMPYSLLIKLKQVFPKSRLMQTFGTSETGIAQTSSRSSDSLEIKFNDPNLEYKIMNGELWLKSQTQVMGYLNASMENFTADGWFKTGDLVEELDANYIRIIGRAKEVINVGGEKVLPAEVESVILELDEVEDCLVFGEKNSITGQLVAVQIVLERGVGVKQAKTLVRKHCKERLDRYKVPAKFEFADKTDYGDRFKKKRIRE